MKLYLKLNNEFVRIVSLKKACGLLKIKYNSHFKEMKAKKGKFKNLRIFEIEGRVFVSKASIAINE